MAPAIKDGSEVLVSSIPFLFLKPKVGDIVAFWHLNKILIKRIKSIKSSRYLIEGDNISDSLNIGWVDKSVMLGKVLLVL
jgi:signal peptidase I